MVQSITVDGGANLNVLNFGQDGTVATDTGASITGTFNTVNYIDIDTVNLLDVLVTVPTLTEWGVIVLILLLAYFGCKQIKQLPRRENA